MNVQLGFILWLLWLNTHSKENVFQPEVIIDRLEKAATWQSHNPAPFGELEWHWAPYYMGLTDLYEITEDENYLQTILDVGIQNNWKIGPRKYHADDHAVGLSYIKIYQLTKNPQTISKLKGEFDWILANPPEKTIQGEDGKIRLRYNRERWNWSDALYMAAPVWTGLGAVTEEKKYLDYMIQEWKQSHEWYWSEKDSLYFHDKRDISKVSPGGQKVFWARGDGWVMAALVEVLQFLPKDHSERDYFIGVFKKMAAKLIRIQKVNGTWAPSLLDPLHPDQDDISGSVFFVYGLAWGINNGILDHNNYESHVRKGWEALCERQKPNGRLINIQPVGGYPVAFDPETTAVFGVGGFLSAGSEVWKMVQR
ncbi:glycoside hydrolase family 105 protein [Echinicola sp. 20G]|uniref:glycoside hydrolase family 88/105 protein n=1 Tax=Echinicola sp. 20G TaxID=2781961 RepID=UPI0019103606|nr:glycoside hydrolase family 88 protein [Echinicola sp. 20G]